MKKKILIIGNTDGLPGVPADLCAYDFFFSSPMGGNWRHEEIDILHNPTQRCLFKKIIEIEKADYDYLITIYLGHGGEMGHGTVLVINGLYETVAMQYLTNLSPKQLLIIECCRCPLLLSSDITSLEAETTRLSMFRDPIRQAYEDRIQAACPQEIILFAADQGELTWGTRKGGEYSSYLLAATRTALIDSNSPFISVNHAHNEAVSLMQTHFYTRQHPQIQQTRCPINRRLPWAVNPNLWFYDY